MGGWVAQAGQSYVSEDGWGRARSWQDRGMWDQSNRQAGLGCVGLEWGQAGGVQGRLGCVGLAGWVALVSQDTTSLCPQVSDERRCQGGCVWLGFDCGGPAHLPACYGSWGTTIPQLVAGMAQGVCRTPHSAMPGLTQSSFLGICPLVAPGPKEGGTRPFACLGLWLSFLPSPPPLLFLCWGGCFSPPRTGWQGYI